MPQDPDDSGEKEPRDVLSLSLDDLVMFNLNRGSEGLTSTSDEADAIRRIVDRSQELVRTSIIVCRGSRPQWSHKRRQEYSRLTMSLQDLADNLGQLRDLATIKLRSSTRSKFDSIEPDMEKILVQTLEYILPLTSFELLEQCRMSVRNMDVRISCLVGEISGRYGGRAALSYLLGRWQQRFGSLETIVADVSPWVDLHLIRRWLDHCDNFHSSHCSAAEEEQNLFQQWPTYLIDVSRKCLVDARPGIRYAALSYVWGSGGSFRTLIQNLASLKREGSLTAVLIPTIRDVIELVHAIGERYVWIDALCIVQDDEVHKQEHIKSMGSIYANAYVTIIAAGGTAFEGLRGIEGLTPPLQRRRHELAEMKIRNLVEAHQVDMDKSIWSTRGWTFQEQIFSRRTIVLGNCEVVWQCHCAMWFEGHEPYGDAECEDNRSMVARAFDFYTEPNLDDIVEHICQYNKRELTYPDDVLDAFGGIMSVLGSFYPGGFIQGLPLCLFDAALLWKRCRGLVTERRRPKKLTSVLPSWSWAAYPGYLSWTRRSVIPLVQWSYKADCDTQMQSISSSVTDSANLASECFENCQQSYSHILHCRPSHRILPVISLSQTSLQLIIGDPTDPVYIDADEALSEPYPTFCEVIAISRNLVENGCEQDNRYDEFNIMWITWEEGIARRKGLGVSRKTLWLEGPVDKIDLMLG